MAIDVGLGIATGSGGGTGTRISAGRTWRSHRQEINALYRRRQDGEISQAEYSELLARISHDEPQRPERPVCFGASLALLVVGVALTVAFVTMGPLGPPGWVLAVGLCASVGAVLLALWSAATVRQRRLARWLAIGIAAAIAIGVIGVLVQGARIASGLTSGG